jgi:hypothetical protein
MSLLALLHTLSCWGTRPNKTVRQDTVWVLQTDADGLGLAGRRLSSRLRHLQSVVCFVKLNLCQTGLDTYKESP